VEYFARKIDDKNRLTIPSELHKVFRSGVVVTRGFEKSLHLYPKNLWDREMLKALEGEILDEKITQLNEKFRIGKTQMQLDGKQGRIKLDKFQLSYAQINKEVIAYQAQKGFWVVKNPKFVK